MATAYVITEGEYSAYRILAVFTSKALAQEYVRIANPDGDDWKARIEEWPINVAADFKAQWQASVAIHDGRVPEPVTQAKEIAEPGKLGVALTWGTAYTNFRPDHPYCLVTVRQATAERALKVLSEQVAIVVAQWDVMLAAAIESEALWVPSPPPTPPPPPQNTVVDEHWFCTDCGSGPVLLPVADSPDHQWFAHHAPSCGGNHDPEVLAKALAGRRVYGQVHL